MEQKKKVKFTVGDYVVFIDGSNVPGAMMWLSGMKKYVGKRDRIQYMGSEGRTCKLEHIPFLLNLEWIKPAESAKPPKRTIVIEITDDGATAKYIVGKKVEKKSAVKRYSYDKPSDKAAAYYAVCKLFGGDLSEVVEKLTTAVASADKARDLLVDLIKGN